jgi:glycosyltransferase involved in cell wall biosynthesis
MITDGHFAAPKHVAGTAPGGLSVGVVIPALNEAQALPHVLAAIPQWVRIVVVADNGSTDGTAAVARAHGATVASEPIRGYGRACLTGIAAMPAYIDVIVFLDGDASDTPSDMARLIAPIAEGRADMVLGSRTLGSREPGSLTPQQVFGNWLACTLIRLVWGQRFTDLGPFRAIRADKLRQLGMADPDFGWTVEMQVKAARQGLATLEIPVGYRRRIGKSKISGTVRGVIGAGTKILYVIGREAVFGPRREKNACTAETSGRDRT